MNVKEDLSQFILAEFRDRLPDDFDASQLKPDTDLIGQSIIDSMGLLMLIAHISRHYSVEIDTVDMTRDNFESIQRIEELVYRKLQSAASIGVDSAS